MNLMRWLKRATHQLNDAGIGTARLDALILLEDITGLDRAWLLAHPEMEISEGQLKRLNNLFNRRAKHEPIAYLLGKTEFYGREFLITPAVLEPRPESETMIDLLKKLPDLPSHMSIADVGTGSGAIGITAALELTEAKVELLEIDEAAIKVAKMNVDKFTLTISVIKSNLLNDTVSINDVLLCNLPYVPDSFQINPAAMREPRIAIFGGPDGLDLYRKLFKQVQNLSHMPLYILCEALPPQHEQLQSIAHSHNYKLCQSEDFIQVFRHVKI